MQAKRTLAVFAGESNLKKSSIPSSLRASFMAFLNAKNTEDAKNNGGSPTAY